MSNREGGLATAPHQEDYSRDSLKIASNFIEGGGEPSLNNIRK